MLCRTRTSRGAIAALLVGAALATSFVSTPEGHADPQGAGPAAAAKVPAVLLLHGRPDGTRTTLSLTRVGADPVPLAHVDHLPFAVVRGAATPSGDVAVTADTRPGVDVSFNASLFLVHPHAAARRLVDDVVHASRPLVLEDGRVFVSRGRAGPVAAGASRVDDLTIDEVDLSTGTATARMRAAGYLLFLAGSIDGWVVVYRVDEQGASLVAFDATGSGERVLVPSMAPFARDFSIDPVSRAVVFQNRHPSDPHRWAVHRVRFDSGQADVVAEGGRRDLVPHAWPGGGVVYNASDKGQLLAIDANLSSTAALGPGRLAIQATSASPSDPGGSFVAGLRTDPGALPTPFVMSAHDGKGFALPVPPGERAFVAGVARGGKP
jgi:hypothetical protein